MSERYEGLNLPQLLELLHPPVVPELVSWLPQTVGWQILGLWALVTSILLVVYSVKAWRRNRYRRDALAVLDEIASRRHEASAPGEIALLIKRTALAVFPRERVANLYGEEWAQFLCESSGGDPRVVNSAHQLATAAYRDGVSGADLVKPAKRWIKVHRA